MYFNPYIRISIYFPKQKNERQFITLKFLIVNDYLYKVDIVLYTVFMEKILISACLMGDLVRYDGIRKKLTHPVIEKWKVQGRLVRFCPEVAGGLETPRPPAEIISGDGFDVLEKRAWLKTSTGENVTQSFIEGALLALDQVKTHAIKIAILKERSPSCGSNLIYDGSFKKRLVSGMGVTTAILRGKGILVFSENELEAAALAFKDNF